MSRTIHKSPQPVRYPMRIQARAGSPVESYYYNQSVLPGGAWPTPEVIAPGVNPAPLEDLIFHGGKTVAQMGFRNIFLGSSTDWVASDIQFIDAASTRAMQDMRLNNVMAQYFPGGRPTCDALQSLMLNEAKPVELDEPGVQAKIVSLFNAGRLGQKDLDRTIFNLVLPPGTILTLEDATSIRGLGGYHGSVHVGNTTLYYSANVFSQMVDGGAENGIVAFDQSWKNVVATLYHEMNEFRTDADVNDAIHRSSNDFLGWMSRDGKECGDQPINAARNRLELVFQEVTASGGGSRIPVQFMYSNAVHGAEGPIDSPDMIRRSPQVIADGSAAHSPQDATGTGTRFPFAATIDKVIARHLDDLRRPGVLSARPGYQSAGGWITKKPAIVVTVDRKTDELQPAARLPETIEGIPVDVREASPLQRLRVSNPLLYQAVSAQIRSELLPPSLAFERDLSGQNLPQIEAAAAAARKPKKLQIDYTAPADFPLNPIEGEFTLICHASPDAGWTELKDFLGATESHLTVGMYDFTSAHILQTLTSSLQRTGSLDLVLDHPAPDRTLDQSDEDTQTSLQDALGRRFQFAWALEDRDPKVDVWIFPSAYHIKVAVRDSKAFWLSSGNWNNSNQPDIDPFNDPQGAAATLKTSDRDWHVIVEHEQLAALFEAYLQNDLRVAARNQATAPQSALTADALAALAQPEVMAQSRVPRQFFAPRTITANMKIQPVLTPDNYAPIILQLINSASRTLYMQMPYITPVGTPEGDVLAGLIAAIASKVRAGLDVRLILSSFAKVAALEQLQAMGIDNSVIRIQNNLHNKGIIVDSSVVAVGSQNWSAPGVTTNRDATLVIFNDQAARYWEEIFIHDWVNMSTQQAGD